MTQTRRMKFVGISVLAALTATGLSAVVPRGAYRAAWTDPLAMIRHYAPGLRAPGALTNKFKRFARVAPVRVAHERVRPAKVALRRPKPVYAVLPTAVAPPVPVVALPSVPIAAAASPIPAAFVPVVAGGGGAIGLLPILGGIGGILLTTVVLTPKDDVSPR